MLFSMLYPATMVLFQQGEHRLIGTSSALHIKFHSARNSASPWLLWKGFLYIIRIGYGIGLRTTADSTCWMCHNIMEWRDLWSSQFNTPGAVGGVPGRPNSWLAGCRLRYVAFGLLSPPTLSVYYVLKIGEGLRWKGVAGMWTETLIQSPTGDVSG